MDKGSKKPFVKSDYDSAWRKANYEQVITMFPKGLKIGKTLDIASKKACVSKREYVRQAIIEKLHNDGFDVTIDKP